MINKDFKRSLDTTSEAYRDIKREFLELAKNLGLKEEHLPVWDSIEKFISDLVINQDWTRKSIYELVNDVLNNDQQKLPEDAIAALSDYEGAICGDCAAEYIPRFPGEPKDMAEFRDYIYSLKWLE